MRRRDFLIYGVVSTGAILGTHWHAVSRGGAGEASAAGHLGQHGTSNAPWQKTEDFSYRGRRIQIFERGPDVQMRVDGRVLSHHTIYRSDKRYASHLLPFEDFVDSKVLARRLVDGDGTFFLL
jgi:hypothetical protein